MQHGQHGSTRVRSLSCRSSGCGPWQPPLQTSLAEVPYTSLRLRRHIHPLNAAAPETAKLSKAILTNNYWKAGWLQGSPGHSEAAGRAPTTRINYNPPATRKVHAAAQPL
jgi:hypothetical protein